MSTRWLRLDNDTWQNKKVVALSVSAECVYYRMLQWAHHTMSDGFIDARFKTLLGRGVRSFARAIEELEQQGLLERVEGGWQIHDYLEMQQSRAEIEERKQRSSTQARKAVQVRWARNGSTKGKEQYEPDTTRIRPGYETLPTYTNTNTIATDVAIHTQVENPVLRVWATWNNEPALTTHRLQNGKIPDRFVKHIKRAIMLYGVDDLCESIKLYAQVIGDPAKYFFTHKWPLDLYCKQDNAAARFLPESQPLQTWQNKNTLDREIDALKGWMDDEGELGPHHPRPEIQLPSVETEPGRSLTMVPGSSPLRRLPSGGSGG